MKIQKYLRKILILLVFLLAGNSMKAQNNCASAIIDTASNDCKFKQHFFNNSDVYWIKFVAASNHVFIKIGDSLQKINPVSSISLYSGRCDSLVLMDENNTDFILDDSALTIGHDYYIKILQAQPNSNRFDLLIKNLILDQDIYPCFTIVGSSAICCDQSITIMNCTNPAPNWGEYFFGYAGHGYVFVACSTLAYGETFTISFPCTLVNAPDFVPPLYETQLVMVHSSFPCGFYDSYPINVYPLPDIAIIPNNPSICPGESVTLNASGAESYAWSNGENTASITVSPLVTTTYTVTGPSSHGCTESKTVTVIVDNPIKPILTGIFNTCKEGKTTYTVSNYSSGTGTWTYGIVINGIYTNIGTLNSQYFYIDWDYYPSGGLIIVNYTGLYGCTDSDSLMVFPCCTTGADYSYANQTITNPLSFSGNTININGIVTLDANVIITNASTVYMGPNAKIIVAPNRTLTIGRNSIIQACSDLMWDGIYITGNLASCTISSSTIMDAKCAVVSDNGGVFNITASTFNKNYKDIYVAPYPYNHSGNVKSTKFICTAALKPQYPAITATQTNVGIAIIQVPNITIGGTSTLADSNYFSQMDIALWILNSTVNVYNNSFKNIVQGTVNPGQVKGYGIFAFYLPQYSKYATTYLNAGDENTSTVFKANRFRNCTNGIYSYNNEGFVIKYNTFNNSGLSSSQKGTAISIDELYHATGTTKLINSNTISNIRVGINLNIVNQATVQKNTISNLVYYWPALEPTSGINMNGCNTNTIICNTISNASVTYTYGIKGSNSLVDIQSNTITRMQNGIYFTGVSDPTTIKGNKLYYCTYGLHLSNGGIIGTQGIPGNPLSYSNANTWTGSTGSDLFTSDNTDGTQSGYYYKGTQPTSGSTGSIPIPVFSATNNVLLISCTMLPSGLNEVTTSFDEGALESDQGSMESIVNDEINYTTYPTESREISQQNVYKHLLNTDTVNISAELKTFMQEKTTGDLGKIEMIAQKAFAGDMEQANIVNNAITENEKTVTAIKDVNTILLNAITDDAIHFYKFADDELLALQNMAKNCPYEYGNAVYMARSALRSIDTTVYQNECENSNPVLNQKRLSGNNQNSPEISIYPNPANTELHIDCMQSIDMQVMFYDYTGKLVYNTTLNDLKNTINLNKFSDGIYTLRILNNNLQLRIEKITIIN